MTTCVSGCTVRGMHAPDCDGTTTDLVGRLVECLGCMPRPVVEGVLCGRCWGRLQSAVRTLPSLVEHLYAVAAPSVSSPSGHTGGGIVPPGPRALYSQALGAADDLVGMLAAWCDQVAGDRGLAVPRPPGLWLTDDGEAVAGVRSPGAARYLADWLGPYLSWCAAQPWAGDMVEDLGPAVARASAAWPVEEPDRRITTVRCPRCGRRSLVLHPPRVERGSLQVSCSVPSCGAVLSEEDWARARSWAVAVARMAAGPDDAPEAEA